MTRAAIEELSTVHEKVFCMQHQGFVSKDQMTTLHTNKVVRRVCHNCKDAAIDRKNAERKVKA